MKKIAIFLWIIFIVSIGDSFAMELRSREFVNNGYMPKKFTCQGENINPELVIENIPPETKSLALILDDPDAFGKAWVHWIVFNIPLISVIKENTAPGIQGSNDFGRPSYDGPCPPLGVHRYVFKVYALDATLELKEGVRKVDLERAIKGHVLADAELIGLYEK